MGLNVLCRSEDLVLRTRPSSQQPNSPPKSPIQKSPTLSIPQKEPLFAAPQSQITDHVPGIGLVRGLTDAIAGGIDWVGSRSINSAYQSPTVATNNIATQEKKEITSDKEMTRTEASTLHKIKEQLAKMPLGDEQLGQTPWDDLKARDLLLVWEEYQAMRQWIHGFKSAIKEISDDTK